MPTTAQHDRTGAITEQRNSSTVRLPAAGPSALAGLPAGSRAATSNRPRTGPASGGWCHAHLLCPPVRPCHAAGAAKAAGRAWGASFWGCYAPQRLGLPTGRAADLLTVPCANDLSLPQRGGRCGAQAWTGSRISALPSLADSMQVPRLKAQAVHRVLQTLADTYATGKQRRGALGRLPPDAVWRAALPPAPGQTPPYCTHACCLELSLLRLTNSALPSPHPAAYSALLEPGSGYDATAVQAEVRHTPAHVRTLLGVV